MHFSIHNKILVSFCLVVFLGLFSLQFASYKFNEQNIDHIIKTDMTDAKKNIDLYLKQYFLVYNLEMNSTTLLAESRNISRELSSEIGNNVEIYDNKGVRASGLSLSGLDSFKDEKGMNNAIKGKISYSVSHINNRVLVSLSYPIKADDNIIGIVRYYNDYTELYENNEKFKDITNLFAVVIFIVIFVTSIILSQIITRPVRILTRKSDQISKGNFDVNISIKSHDEIGELAKGFKLMTQRIKSQIKFIENDRDHLKKVQKQSKAFFDNVSHEMKTPLTTILGYASIIQENGFTDKEFFDKGISYIISESERLSKMIVSILELSKTNNTEFSYHFRKVDFSKLIENTCDEIKIKGLKYGIGINCSVEKDLVIEGDEDKLKEVIINLIDNSIKYSDVNTTIEVEAHRQNNKVFVKIRDTGDGIPQDILSHIFDPFYKAGSKVLKEKGSVGLGLSIVKNIVEKHGGSININSIVRKGTDVMLEFKENLYE